MCHNMILSAISLLKTFGNLLHNSVSLLLSEGRTCLAMSLFELFCPVSDSSNGNISLGKERPVHGWHFPTFLRSLGEGGLKNNLSLSRCYTYLPQKV